MAQATAAVGRRLVTHLRGTLIAGLLLLVPVVISYLVLRLIFDTIDGVLEPAIRPVLGRSVPGAGIFLLVVLVYITGLIGANVLGRRLIHQGQQLLLRVPFISYVYSTSKQLIESFSGMAATGFRRVVLIEYPRRGTWTLGFLTGLTADEAGRPLALVYIPTAPTPNSGWVAILPVEEVHDTDLSIPVAMRLVLSGGISAPAQIRRIAPASAGGRSE
jgi:uncharacterized membrane protein